MMAHKENQENPYHWKYFFPVQLFLVQIKHSKLLLLTWFLVAGFITQTLLKKYGVPYLYLTPEYLGEVSFISYFILGFSFGGFIMAFNISSYIINGHRFPFLATLARPFFKYFINNVIWSGTLLLMYLSCTTYFLAVSEQKTVLEILRFLIGFLIGLVLIITFILVYFINTNKDFTRLFGKKAEDYFDEQTHVIKPVIGILHKKISWKSFFNNDRGWTVKSYLSNFKKVSIARNIAHYDYAMLQQVFQQNHINAALFEIAVFLSIVFFSFASDVTYFMIPAGASLNLMLTMLLMLTSALHSWFRGWSDWVLVLLLVGLNFLSQFSFFNPPNRAYGLNYTNEPAVYSHENFRNLNNPINYRNDYLHGLSILEKWKQKNLSLQGKTKPKMVLLTSTGGGMRCALWAFLCAQQLDSLLDERLMDHAQLITGSSGGLIGLAYYRELFLQKKEHKVTDIGSAYYVNNMSKDLLNRLGFSWTVNDLLLKLQSFEDAGFKYKKDRGYAFEQQLIENTDGALGKRLYEYYKPEVDATIPMLLISPTIVNDGRRLLISPQPISYLSTMEPQSNVTNDYTYESVEFKRLFKNQNANQLRFSSALRMSSSFPYVMPMAQLPSTPVMEIMDAGIRDNYGIQSTLKFMYTFRNWLSANTSGVIIIQVRDSDKKKETQDNGKNTIFNALSAPLGTVYKNLFVMQDFQHDQLIQYASEWFNSELELVDLVLNKGQTSGLSLSWHLTRKEKNQIYEALQHPENQKAFQYIKQKLKE